jgi:hypothetical protein
VLVVPLAGVIAGATVFTGTGYEVTVIVFEGYDAEPPVPDAVTTHLKLPVI